MFLNPVRLNLQSADSTDVMRESVISDASIFNSIKGI